MRVDEKMERYLLSESGNMDKELESIAKKVLGMDTLKTRNSDDKDFYDLSAASIKSALEKAYEAGQKGK